MSSNSCYSAFPFFLFEPLTIGHVFLSWYVLAPPYFQYPCCWVVNTRTHHNSDNEVTSEQRCSAPAETVIPISTSFPLYWFNFKASWVSHLLLLRIVCVTKAQASYCLCWTLCTMQKALLMYRGKSEWEDGRKCAVCESSRLKSCFRS